MSRRSALVAVLAVSATAGGCEGQVSNSGGPGTGADAGELGPAGVLEILEAHPCRLGHSVMQGMVTDGGDNLYIVFTQAAAADPVLTRWQRAGDSWTCDEAVAGLDLGHANDLAFHPEFADVGRALLITRGVQKLEDRDDTIAVIALEDDGAIGTQRADLVLPHDVSGFCYSATAADGAGQYAGRLTSSLYVFPQEVGRPAVDRARRYAVPALSSNADQGLDCSKNYVWSARSIVKGNANTTNHIYQVTWDGASVQDIRVAGKHVLGANDEAEEVEDVSHVGGHFYIGINRNSAGDIADLVRPFEE